VVLHAPRLPHLLPGGARIYRRKSCGDEGWRVRAKDSRPASPVLVAANGSARPTRPRRAARHPDLVGRDFTATAPNQLRVTDLTFVPTWAGVAHVCLITDAFSRMIVGWRAAGHMRTTMVLDAIEMARWSRGKTLAGLRCHSDAGSQFTSIRYGERLAEIGALPSTGTVGDIDDALAETVNGYYKSELIYGPARTGPWKTVEDVELATRGWVHWHNTSRLHGYLNDIPPAEFEATFYAPKRIDQPLVEIQ
jgi:putative transposase